MARSAEPPASGAEDLIHAELRRAVLDAGFPCLGARAVLHRSAYGFGAYDRLGSRESARSLWHDLCAFIESARDGAGPFSSYIACFRAPAILGEEHFERLLWRQLQLLHEIDAPHHRWDPRVSSDPSDPQFSFSAGGEAFFVVGLHPASSRLARRFAWPTLCFNPHAQFEALREAGTYERMRSRIRLRDRELQGSVNPMLADHGTESEAAQYSGRFTQEGWVCPLQPRAPA